MTVSAAESPKEKNKSAAVAARAVKAKTKRAAKVIKLSAARKAKAAQACPPSALQQEALIVKYRLKARKLGRSILRRWHARMDLDEVDSIVDLSLCEAVKRFDPAKGASFMTFLFYHLKGNLVRAVATAASSNTIPVFNADESETQNGEPSHLFGHQFRAMNSAEVAEAVVSQDAPLPDEMLWRKELHGKSSVACEKLDPLEREIIKRIFLQEQQIMDIAATLGYSRCHISRVKKKALETLYNELSGSMNDIDLGKKPSFDDEEEEGLKLKLVGRRVVHRRRPRSKVSRADRFIPAKAA
jgi:RNA polymerase sigma factor (sigma-70 family)